jgi:hypothetical protein
MGPDPDKREAPRETWQGKVAGEEQEVPSKRIRRAQDIEDNKARDEEGKMHDRERNCCCACAA